MQNQFDLVVRNLDLYSNGSALKWATQALRNKGGMVEIIVVIIIVWFHSNVLCDLNKSLNLLASIFLLKQWSFSYGFGKALSILRRLILCKVSCICFPQFIFWLLLQFMLYFTIHKPLVFVMGLSILITTIRKIFYIREVTLIFLYFLSALLLFNFLHLN